jgi:hypothetical protein
MARPLIDNAMLLNEFLKEHKKIKEQQTAITQLKSLVQQQKNEFRTAINGQREEFDARLKEQDRENSKSECAG